MEEKINHKEFQRKSFTVEPTEIDFARLAAYVDGEGSILISERHYKTSPYPGMYIILVVSNTDPRLLIWCKERFGGTFQVGDHAKVRLMDYKIPYKWHVSCNQAASIIEKCLPYFIVKKEQADVALAFQKTVKYGRGRGVKLTDGERSFRESCKEKLKELRQIRIVPSVLPDSRKLS